MTTFAFLPSAANAIRQYGRTGASAKHVPIEWPYFGNFNANGCVFFRGTGEIFPVPLPFHTDGIVQANNFGFTGYSIHGTKIALIGMYGKFKRNK